VATTPMFRASRGKGRRRFDMSSINLQTSLYRSQCLLSLVLELESDSKTAPVIIACHRLSARTSVPAFLHKSVRRLSCLRPSHSPSMSRGRLACERDRGFNAILIALSPSPFPGQSLAHSESIPLYLVTEDSFYSTKPQAAFPSSGRQWIRNLPLVILSVQQWLPEEPSRCHLDIQHLCFCSRKTV
jgi:hypothetical protein